MKQRKKYIFWCAALLFSGLACYGLFRSGTYLHRILPEHTALFGSTPLNTVCGCYLPDLLWSAGLSCGLFALWLPKGKARFLWIVPAALCGILWEFFQFLHILSGTGDALDCVMYIMGAFIPILIKEKERKQK